jgi:hypothetical protein
MSSPPPYTIGYCTNVHAGVDLPAIRGNLDKYAVPIGAAAGEIGEIGVGLWLPAAAAAQLSEESEAENFSSFLRHRRLHAYTINGFPFDNFHQPVVKHKVYLPTWWQRQRLHYTKQLADILAVLLPESEPVGSISTLPIGWPSELSDPSQLLQAGQNLRELADHLRSIESRTGRRIVVAIEPEPGCILDTTDDVIRWFEEHLPEPHHRTYLSVCHDICHSAVMMESQSEVLSRLAEAGVAIGKVQVSSAIVADWKSMTTEVKRQAMEQLGEFAEDRYLHQTGRRTAGGEFRLAEDLPQLVTGGGDSDQQVHHDQRWVVHFHVPIFLKNFGHLTTSQDDVIACLRTLSRGVGSSGSKLEFTGHLEIETYAWTVLPEAMRERGLAEDVAMEFEWLGRVIAEIG